MMQAKARGEKYQVRCLRSSNVCRKREIAKRTMARMARAKLGV